MSEMNKNVGLLSCSVTGAVFSNSIGRRSLEWMFGEHAPAVPRKSPVIWRCDCGVPFLSKRTIMQHITKHRGRGHVCHGMLE